MQATAQTSIPPQVYMDEASDDNLWTGALHVHHAGEAHTVW